MAHMPITIWRRHTPTCPHASKGRDTLKCQCPLWADGYVNGKRTLRKSLGTRDLAAARRKAAALESPDARIFKTVAGAVDSFMMHCNANGLQESTFRRYRNIFNHLRAYCDSNRIIHVNELTLEALDSYRSMRCLAALTAANEIRTIRQFCTYCRDRDWMQDNPAKKLKIPRIHQANDVEPFSDAEVSAMVRACSLIGNSQYERSRALALILVLRYTALRIGDVAMLSRDRIIWAGDRWKIFLHTEKTGTPVFLPIPEELKAALDALPVPRGTNATKYYFWNGVMQDKTIKRLVDRTIRAVFRKADIKGGHAHRFRHTLATDLLGKGASLEEAADILGNTPEVVRQHYAKWSVARQGRIDDLMMRVHATAVNPVGLRRVK
jgi:site-specific recombinase XerD